MDVAAETGHRHADQLVLACLVNHQRQAAQQTPRTGFQGQQYRHRGACFRLEQIDERIRRLHRVHDGRDDVTSCWRVELLLGGHRLISRQKRSVAAKGIMVNHIEHVVAIAVFDEDITDDVGFTVVDKVKLVLPRDFHQFHESFPHLGKGEFDVMVAKGDRKAMPPGEQATQGIEKWPVAMDDGLQLNHRLLGIQGERLPPGRRRFLLGEKIDEVTVDHQLDVGLAGLFVGERRYECRERGDLGADAKTAAIGVIGTQGKPRPRGGRKRRTPGEPAFPSLPPESKHAARWRAVRAGQ